MKATVFVVGNNSRQLFLSAFRFEGYWESDVLEKIRQQIYDVNTFRQAKQSLYTGKSARQTRAFSRFP